jgi:hypothetical protein
MTTQQKRAIASLWPRRRFEFLREAARHDEIRKRQGEMNALRRLTLTPAAPHSKVYGHYGH